MFFSKPGNLTNWLDAAHLVIGMHYRNQDCFRTNGHFQFVQFHNSKLIHIYISHFKTVSFQIVTHLKNSRMLHRGSDDVITFLFVGKCCSFNGKIIRLRAAAGENNFRGLTIQQPG